MSYRKQNFSSGQVLEADHLNHMEDGIFHSLENAIVCKASGTDVTLSDASNLPIRGLTLYGMTQKVNVGTEESPMYELRSAEVTEVESVGVNLFDLNDFANKNGFIALPDGSYKCTNVVKTMWRNTSKKSGSMYLSYDGAVESGLPITFQCFYTDGTTQYGGSASAQTEYKKYTFVTSESKTVDFMQWTYAESGTYYVKNMMLSFVDTDYTPYFHDVLPIPESVRTLDGYGWGFNETVRNYVDWKNRKFVKMFERVDLGTLTWIKTRLSQGGAQAPITDKKSRGLFLCDKYAVGTREFSWEKFESVADKTINITNSSSSTNIYLKDLAISDEDTFYANVSGVMLYYELAEPVITDISDILPADIDLCTIKPITNMRTDSGAPFEVEYVADQKTYIDNKFAELAAAVVNNA